MKAYRVLASVLACVLAINTPLFGWGNVGHMTVAYAAYQKLTPAAKKRVGALLKLNPDYKKKWSALIPAGTAPKDRPMMFFMIAATWPDQIKGETGYTNDPQGGPNSSQNTGYTDHMQHRYWHFVDTPFSQDGTPLGAIPAPNAGTQIAAFRAVLASSDPDPLKSYDLVWLLHLVGDVHQPLHAATRVSKTDPGGDRGGNNVTLCKKPCKSELHAFWDDLPGTGADPNAAVLVGKKLPKADATLASKTDAATWIAESFAAAQKSVYVNPPIGPGDGPFTLTAAYRAAAQKVAKERVALAGARLANMINNELK
ncbi:MAG: S1/P1 nuclease [Terriglobales bacterium]